METSYRNIIITVDAQKRTTTLGAKSQGRVRFYGVRVEGHAYMNEGGFSNRADAVAYAKAQIDRYVA